ncbi:putative ribonuclease H-like domain-containing protein [Tanacetum coccineum]
MSGTQDENPPPPPPPTTQQTPTQQTPHTVSTIKLPILKKGEYDIWAMKMEHYLAHTDYPIWEVIQNGNGPVSVTTDTTGQIKILPPKTAKEMTDAKEMWNAIKSRFGGNDESKKMQKYILKQQFKGFTLSLIIEEQIHEWNISGFDDLYNNLRVFENDVKGSTASSSNLQNVAFVSENTSSTNDVSTAYGVCNTSGHYSKHEQTSSYSLLASQSSCPQLDHEDLDQVDEYDLEEMDLKWQVAMISMRIKKFYKKTGRKLQFDAKEPVGFDKTKVECYNCHKTGHFARECRTKEDNRRRDGWNPGNKDVSRTGKKDESKALVTVDGESVDWTTHSEDDENYAFMASNSSVDARSRDKRLILQVLKRLKHKNCHQQGQLWYEQKIKFMKIDLDDKTDVLTYHKTLLAKAQKEKDDLEVIVDKWNHSSKNLGKIISYQMSASDKFGLGYGDYRYSGILSYENEVLNSVFKGNNSDFENLPLHKRLAKTCEMQAVPPPMTGNYMPSGPDIEIDDSQYTYGPAKTQPSEFESQTTELDTCDSNISTDPSELVFEPVVNESNIEVQPKVWSDAPIIEEYESDSDDDFSHLIRDCDYHVKLAKQVELNKQNMSKGNGTGERKQTWNNVKRVNKQNQYVPLAVQRRTGMNLVNTAKASSTNNFSTARQNINRQAVLTSTVLKVNTVKPIDNPHRTLKNKGIIDSGCSRHMTGNKAYLADFQDFNGGPVAFGGSKGYRYWIKGKIKTGKLDFEDVSFVKELQHFNLFSVSQMCDKKNKVLFTDSECLVLSPDFKLPDENQILLKVPRQNNMYTFNLENIVPLGGLACLIAKATTDESNLWHRRLGHVNFKNLNRLVKGNLVRGLPTKLFQNDHTCVACQKGKQHKASCKAKLVSSISHTLQLLHMDLFGPTSVRSINHKTYCLVITDDFSRFSWTFFLRTKDETKFKNKDVIEFCGLKGIKREYSNARTPQQNGVAERKNRTLIKAARTMLADSFLPNTFWAEAVSTACYVLNRVLVTKPHNKTPYELLTGKGPNWLFDLDYLTDSMNYHYVSSENQANLHAGQQESNQSSGTKDKVNAGDSEKEDESAQDCFELPIWHSYSSTNDKKGGPREEEQVFLDDLAKLQMQEKEASEEAEALRKNLQQETENLVTQAEATKSTLLTFLYDSEIPPLKDIHEDTTDGIFTHSTMMMRGAEADFTNFELLRMLVLFPHQELIPHHPSTLILRDPTSKQNKQEANLFACFTISNITQDVSKALEDEKPGLMQCQRNCAIEIKKLDPSRFPYGKRASGHRQEEGIDYDEVFAPVARLEAIRIFLAFASYKGLIVYQMDVKSAFLYGKIDERLILSSHQNGYRRGTIDKTLFLKKDKHDIILVQVYVDDIIFGSTKKSWCDEFEALMKSRFQMSSMGELTFFLGLQVKQKPNVHHETSEPLVKDEEAMMLMSISIDRDNAGANLDRKSTTGGCQFLGRRLITWQCKKQTIVATSTTEAEYVAAASCCGQVLWIQNLNTKHNDIRHHFIRDAYEKKLIQVLKIHTDDNVADLLTKAFDCIDTYYLEVILVKDLRRFRESLRRVTEGAEAFLILTLFILCLDKVSTDHAKLVPLGKVCTAKESLEKNTAKGTKCKLEPLISLTDDLTLLSNMAALESCPKHNMIAYLEKTEGNLEFHEVIDFLRRSYIYHAFTVSPVVSTTFVEQFWTSAKSKTINNVRHITAKVVDKSVSISEASIRTDLLFNDADGIDTLPNQAIFNAIQLMGYEGDLTKGKHFSGKVTPLFDTMLVQPTQDEGASSERLSDEQPSPSPAPTSEVPNESLPDSTSAQPSEVPFEQQPDPSPSPSPKPSPTPSPTPIVPDSIPEPTGENLGDHSSNDTSLSGNEDDMTLQNVYDLCISLCQQVSDQAKEIKLLKAKITKLKKQAKPVIKHFKAYLKTVSLQQRFPKKSSSKKQRMHKKYVSKQGRKKAKGESSVQKDPLFDVMPEDKIDHMETENAQSEGRTREMVDEEKEIEEEMLSTEDVVSTDKERVSTDFEKVSTDKPKVSTDGSKVSTDEQVEGTEEIFEGTEEQRESTEEKVESTAGQREGTEDQTKEEIATQASQTSTQTPTSMIFGDDETIATLLINMSKAKAASKEKEKGVELKDVEEIDRPRPTSQRSLLTLKPLPKIDPKDKGKKKIEEEDESESEDDDIPQAVKKFKQLESDEELARKVQEEWEAEEERNKIAEEEATNEALIKNFDDIKARIEADRILAEKLQEQEREQFTIEERAKFLHDTIAAQRKFLAQQRSEAIRNRPPTKNQLRNQMMTYLKHVGNFKHFELKSKKFEDIQAMYEKIKKSDEDFIAIGSVKDDKLIKKMNKKDSSKGEEIKQESKEEVKEEDKEEEDTRKRKHGTMKKMKSRKRRFKQDTSQDDLSDIEKENDELRLCLTIAPNEDKEVDYEILNKKYPIIDWKTEYLGTKPQFDESRRIEEINLNVITRSNGQKRYFSTLMRVLSVFDREDLDAVYRLVMDIYQDKIPEGFDRVLWGDLIVMFNPDEQDEFWNSQHEWNVVSWKLHSSSGVHTLMTEEGLVIHMLIEKKYPLKKEIVVQMLKLKLESEEESTMALELIRFIKKSWLVQDQTVLGKDYSNLLIADSLLKTIWFINAPCYDNEALASPNTNDEELSIPEQTATGKGTSNPLMAGSLPKTTKPT